MRFPKLFYLLPILLLLGLMACQSPADTNIPATLDETETADPAPTDLPTTVTETDNSSPPPPAVVADPVVEMAEPVLAADKDVDDDKDCGSETAVFDPIQANLSANTELSAAEAATLIFMREEEKLARDVYLTFYEMWQLPLFQNIANSEQTHMDNLLRLLDRYDLPDPVQQNPVGVFADADLQTLYDEMTAQGSQSLLDALRVAAALEEIDILDLQAGAAETDKADIQTTYLNLIAGSENHLRAFVRVIERQTGEAYAPQYLPVDYYATILQGEIGRNGAGVDNPGLGQGRAEGGQGLRGASGPAQP